MRSQVVRALVATACLSGCAFTHHLRLEGFDADPVPLTNSARRRVVIVVDPAALPSTQTTSADGHTFVFEELDGFYERALRSALRERVASVEVARGPAPPGYDAYVYPSLTLDMSASLVMKECAADYGLRVEDGAGRVLAEQRALGRHSFGVIGSADNACTLAMLQAFGEVTNPVLSAIDRVAGPTAGGEEPVRGPVGSPPTPTGFGATPRAVPSYTPGRATITSGWLDSPSRPEGAYNPSIGYGGDDGLMAAGIVLWTLAYLGSITESMILFIMEGSPTGLPDGLAYPSYEDACDDISGGLSLIPLVGPLIGAIELQSCRVPHYESTDGGWQLVGSMPAHAVGAVLAWSFAIPTTAVQLLGFSLFLAGATAHVPGVVFEASLDRMRHANISLSINGTGLLLQIRHW